MRAPVPRSERVYDSVSERQKATPQLVRAVDLARELGVTPNQIWTWKRRKDRNGFPAPIACTWSPWRGPRFSGRDLHDLEEVQLWFKEYDVHKQRVSSGAPSGRVRRQK